MNRQDIIDLTGEDPEDMFGGDWANEVAELQLSVEDVENNK